NRRDIGDVYRHQLREDTAPPFHHRTHVRSMSNVCSIVNGSAKLIWRRIFSDAAPPNPSRPQQPLHSPSPPAPTPSSPSVSPRPHSLLLVGHCLDQAEQPVEDGLHLP